MPTTLAHAPLNLFELERGVARRQHDDRSSARWHHEPRRAWRTLNVAFVGMISITID
jgi:hypothetical protein